MSTLVYAMISPIRDTNRPDAIAGENSLGLRTYVDALSALVPAEVLSLHAMVLTVTTKTDNGQTTITEPGTLAWAFWGLVLLNAVLYVGARVIAQKWDRLDLVRVFIPPLAFIGWTMLQRATAFDAVFRVSDGSRTVIGLFLAVLLGLVAAGVAYKADKKLTSERVTEESKDVASLKPNTAAVRVM